MNNEMVTDENFDSLHKIVQLLESKIEYFKDQIHLEIGSQYIQIWLPGGNEHLSYTITEFETLGEDIKEFKIIDTGRIKTKGITYQIVKMANSDLEHYLRKTEFFFTVEEIAILRLTEANDWIAFACLAIGAYHEFGVNCEEYSVVMIEYQDDIVISYEEETNLIYSYLFEIADTTGHIYYLSKIQEYDTELSDKIQNLYSVDDDHEDDNEEELILRPLLDYTDAIRLHVSALQTTDVELRLLNFYKILEYFAPIVISIDSYEQLSKKLDSPKVLKPDRAYLKSIFNLVDANRLKLRDNELIKSVVNKCFDLVELFGDLPVTIQKKLLGNIKEQKFDYELSKEKLVLASNYLSTIIYSTRNKVVHAKSNFEPSGEECPVKDMEQFNIFLRKATARTIRWHSKLPDFQKTNDY